MKARGNSGDGGVGQVGIGVVALSLQGKQQRGPGSTASMANMVRPELCSVATGEG